MVTEAYQRRYAMTGERTLPVLQASHIKPYAESGPHRVDNGLLLRADPRCRIGCQTRGKLFRRMLRLSMACPAVVVSNDAANRYLNRVKVVPLSSRIDRIYPSEAPSPSRTSRAKRWPTSLQP